MTLDTFWTLIARVNEKSPGNMAAKCELLREELRQLTASEVLSFAQHFCECFRRAYTWDLWGAAFLIGGDCGDDSFMDFRSTLISLGREIFERALANPETLADHQLDGDTSQYEGFQYVDDDVYREKTGNELPLPIFPYREPAGVRFDERAMSQRFPKLVTKYGYDESQW